jgi:hypothetical protein
MYAYQYPVKTLQRIHEPYARSSKWQIKRARSTCPYDRPRYHCHQEVHHRINLDMSKVDHFVDFLNGPYFHHMEYEHLSKRTLYRILEVREANQRKSLQGVDHTAAEGSAAFETLQTILSS